MFCLSTKRKDKMLLVQKEQISQKGRISSHSVQLPKRTKCFTYGENLFHKTLLEKSLNPTMSAL